MWPEEQEFVRIVRFNATIVPLSGVGIDDSLEILASSQEILTFLWWATSSSRAWRTSGRFEGETLEPDGAKGSTGCISSSGSP